MPPEPAPSAAWAAPPGPVYSVRPRNFSGALGDYFGPGTAVVAIGGIVAIVGGVLAFARR